MPGSPATLPPATRSALALVVPAAVARDGAADQLLVLGAATAAGLRCSAFRAGKGRVLLELRQLPPCSLAWIAREMERHLGPGWKVALAGYSHSHLLARRVRP